MGYIDLKINNSKKAAIPIRKKKITGQWKDPGAKLYDQLLDAQHIIGDKVPDGSEEFEELIREGKYLTWQTYIKEAYGVAPVKDIKNSPYGRTPFSSSGCKYPHHVIKNGELVVSIPGLRAAYICARNEGCFDQNVSERPSYWRELTTHFNRHFKELGLKPVWRYGEFYLEESVTLKIESNFNSINSFIMERAGINLFDESNYFEFLKSDTNENFKPRGTKSLSDFTMMEITKKLKKKFAKQGKLISYMRDYDPKYDDECLIWVDDQGNYVCSITYDKVPSEKDGHKWISGIDVAYAYNGYGLSHQLLDYAIKHGVDALSVQVDNQIALKVYKDHGFEISPESQYKVDNGLSYQYDMFLLANPTVAESFINSDIYEASHGKLKYDFRDAFDYDTGHALKIVYSLDNIRVTGTGGHYLNDNKSGQYSQDTVNGHVQKIQKDITRKGSLDHQSTGQVVVAIIDRSDPSNTQVRLNSTRTIGPYSPGVSEFNKKTNFRSLIIPPDELKKIHDYYNKQGQDFINRNVHTVEVGKVDNSKSFKSTKWFKQYFDALPGKNGEMTVVNNMNRMRTASEHLAFGRGAKMDDIDPDFPLMMEPESEYRNPSKKDKKRFARKFNMTESVMSNEAVIFSKDILDEIGNTPQELYEWMHNNIEYDKSLSDWTLKSPSEVFINKKGNCHDQSLFEAFILHSLRIPNGQLFFVEYSKDNLVRGNAHTLTWYRIDKDNSDYPHSYYWIENAWENQAGIHGPYNDLDGLKHAVFKAWENDDDLNSNKYDKIIFSERSSYRIGMSLSNYCCSWKLDNEHSEDSVIESINGLLEWVDAFVHDDEFRESVVSINNEIDGLSRRKSLGHMLSTINTPEELNIFMDSIEYGFITKTGERIDQNHENFDDGNFFYKEYYLQSPGRLLQSKLGVCWDQTELERCWFSHRGINHAVIYIEIDDVEDIPTHTFLIYEDDEGYYWFEHSWGQFRGIHKFIHLKDLITTVISNHQQFNNDNTSPVNVRLLSKAPSFGITCDEFMNYARNQNGIDISDIGNEIFGESATLHMTLTEETENDENLSEPKKVDKAESDKNGVRRKKLYIAFIEWCKAYNNKNVFGSIFDKDAFKITYPFIPNEMRYFYRLANPILCILGGQLTFFQASELRKLNSSNPKINELLIFAATPTDMRVFNNNDKKIYRGVEEDGQLKLSEVLGTTFDEYIQNMINQGDILNGPIE